MAKLRAERLHAWEKRLTTAQEEALLTALTAYRDAGHDLLVHHEAAKVDLLEPPAVVSLYALTDVFLADPSSVARTLDEWSTHEKAGASLVLSRSFADEPEASRFATQVSTLLTGANPVPDGFEGAGHDDRRGSVELSVRVGKTTNTLCVDLARVLERVRAARTRDESAPMPTLIRKDLRALIDEQHDGALWTRTPASDDERAIARRCLDATTS